MKIKVSELKQFKGNSSFIKQTNILPVLGYLKFDDGCITKSNMGCFLVQEVDGVNESFLVDEKILMNFMDCTSAPEIEIKLKDKRVLITDGNTKVFSPTEDIINFPKHESEFVDGVVLSNKTLMDISIASNFIISDPLMPFRSHVFVGRKHVAGSNSFIAYIAKSEDEVPEIILSKDTAMAVGKLPIASFSQTDRWHLFKTDKAMYGFIKPEINFFDVSQYGVFDRTLPSFEIDKTDMIRFNDMCISSSPSKDLTASFKINDGNIKLEMQDIDYEISITKDIPVNGSMEGTFIFIPANINQLLKNIPDTNLTFTHSKPMFYITAGEEFTTLIMGVDPNFKPNN